MLNRNQTRINAVDGELLRRPRDYGVKARVNAAFKACSAAVAAVHSCCMLPREREFEPDGPLTLEEHLALTCARRKYRAGGRGVYEIWLKHSELFAAGGLRLKEGGSGSRTLADIAQKMLDINARAARGRGRAASSPQAATRSSPPLGTPVGTPVQPESPASLRIRELEALVERLTVSNVRKDERIHVLETSS